MYAILITVSGFCGTKISEGNQWDATGFEPRKSLHEVADHILELSGQTNIGVINTLAGELEPSSVLRRGALQGCPPQWY